VSLAERQRRVRVCVVQCKNLLRLLSCVPGSGYSVCDQQKIILYDGACRDEQDQPWVSSVKIIDVRVVLPYCSPI
jgi:hypothetical protein